MNGLTLKETFLNALNEASEDMVELPLLSIYRQLDAAALLYVRETNGGIARAATITTVAGQQSYDLPADFVRLYVRSRRQRFVIKYDYDGQTAWPALASYGAIFKSDPSQDKTVPGWFAIHEQANIPTALTGAATADGALADGVATLTDSGADFADVALRDTVVNTTRESRGLVVALTGATQLGCALFPEGLNSWRSGDGYVVAPQARKQVFLETASVTAGHVLTVPYMALPEPVYTSFGAWRLDDTACYAIAHEAAFMFCQSHARRFKPVSAHHALFVDAVRAERIRVARSALYGVQ